MSSLPGMQSSPRTMDEPGARVENSVGVSNPSHSHLQDLGQASVTPSSNTDKTLVKMSSKYFYSTCQIFLIRADLHFFYFLGALSITSKII